MGQFLWINTFQHTGIMSTELTMDYWIIRSSKWYGRTLLQLWYRYDSRYQIAIGASLNRRQFVNAFQRQFNLYDENGDKLMDKDERQKSHDESMPRNGNSHLGQLLNTLHDKGISIKGEFSKWCTVRDICSRRSTLRRFIFITNFWHHHYENHLKLI